MTKKSASKSAFFNLRVLIGLCVALAGISLALLGLDAYAAKIAPYTIRNHIVTASNDPLVPVGFDCSKIAELGIHKQENFRAGAIMLACGAETPDSASVAGFFQRIGLAVKNLLGPLYGLGDVNLITGTETPPNIVQSETFTTVNPENPNEIVVAYNDSRGRNASPINISGASVSKVTRWLRLVGAPWKRLASLKRPWPANSRISGSGNQVLESLAVVCLRS